MFGGPGNDLMIGGQPCDGDIFDGGPGDNDSASFARVRNSGIVVKATIGGAVTDPDVAGCNAGQIEASVEKIEGSPGPDILIGDDGANMLLGRGGNDLLDGRGGRQLRRRRRQQPVDQLRVRRLRSPLSAASILGATLAASWQSCTASS